MGIIFQITPSKNHSVAQFDILYLDKELWKKFFIDLTSTNSKVAFISWQIVSKKGKDFARVTFNGEHKICLQLLAEFKVYKNNFNKYIKSDFANVIPNVFHVTEVSIDDVYNNSNFEDTDYYGNFEDCRWLDYGYMNDISNPFEVY